MEIFRCLQWTWQGLKYNQRTLITLTTPSKWNAAVAKHGLSPFLMIGGLCSCPCCCLCCCCCGLCLCLSCCCCPCSCPCCQQADYTWSVRQSSESLVMLLRAYLDWHLLILSCSVSLPIAYLNLLPLSLLPTFGWFLPLFYITVQLVRPGLSRKCLNLVATWFYHKHHVYPSSLGLTNSGCVGVYVGAQWAWILLHSLHTLCVFNPFPPSP